MITILSTLVSLLSFRVRSRASLELELIALRHQLIVLRRQRPGGLRLFLTDRLFWVSLLSLLKTSSNPETLAKLANCAEWA
jgi:putative transposase